MKTKTALILQAAIFVALFLFPSLVHAQGGPGGDPDTLPVDGGLSILAAAGVAYGVKKIRDYKKNKNGTDM